MYSELLSMMESKKRAAILYGFVTGRSKELPKVTIDAAPTGWSFRVRFDGTPFGLSLSTPPDDMDLPETALVCYNGDAKDAKWSLIYLSDAEYSDVNKFETNEEVIAEVQRVSALAVNGTLAKLWSAENRETEETKAA